MEYSKINDLYEKKLFNITIPQIKISLFFSLLSCISAFDFIYFTLLFLIYSILNLENKYSMLIIICFI